MARVLVVAVSLLLLLAGCSTFVPGPGPGTPPVEATPAPVPTDDRVDGQLAPGVTPDGVVSSRALAEAHVARLEGRGFELAVNRTTRYSNGTLRGRLRLDLTLEADRAYIVHTETEGPRAPVYLGRPPAEATFWSNGSTYTRRLTRDGTTTYTEFQPTDGAGTWQYWARTVPYGGRGGNPRGFITRTFSAVPTRVTGRVQNSDATLYRLAGDRATAPIELGVSDPREVDLRATVTPAGLVRSVSLSYVGTVDGEPIEVTRRFRYTAVGNASVDRPPWVDRALSE